MPRLSTKPTAKRTRRVPIHVLESDDSERETPGIERHETAPLNDVTEIKPVTAPNKNQPIFQLSDQPVKRTALIWGVGLSFMLVLTIWISAMRLLPKKTGPNSADATLANIGRVLADYTTNVSQQVDTVKQQLEATDGTVSPEVSKLQQQVFPEFYK